MMQVKTWLSNARLRLWRPALQALIDPDDSDSSSANRRDPQGSSDFYQPGAAFGRPE